MEVESEGPWSARPSVRPYVAAALLAGGLGYGLSLYVGPAFSAVINATPESAIWTQGFINKVYYTLQVLVYLPLLVVGFKILKVLSTRYELSDGRFLYTHGLVFRKHDQIALQRVRDYRVLRPILQRMFGTGTVSVISRDETYPELVIGPFANPLGVEEIIRHEVLAQQKATGFREFEST